MDKWFFPMRTVPQQGMGCALACVATIAGVSFNTAKKAAFPRDWRDRTGFGGGKNLLLDEDRTLAAFRRLGWQARPVNDFRRLISPSIVFIQFDPRTIHAMVWDPFIKEFRDPGNGWYHRKEIMGYWREGRFRSVTVTGRLPGSGPAPDAPESDTPPLRGTSVDPVTGADDADLDDFEDGLCGCDDCVRIRRLEAQASANERFYSLAA